MYVDGHSYSEIIAELNNRGYRTRRRDVFGKNNLYSTLKNELKTELHSVERKIRNTADLMVEIGSPSLKQKLLELEESKEKLTFELQQVVVFPDRVELVLNFVEGLEWTETMTIRK